MSRAHMVPWCVAAVLTLSAVSVRAQLPEGGWLLGPRGGYSLPVKDLNEVAHGDWSLGASGDYVFAEDFAAGIVVSYNHLRERSAFIRDAIGTSDYEASLSIPYVGLYLRWLLQMEGRTYFSLRFGPGFYSKNSTLKAPTAANPSHRDVDQSETTGGLDVGAGFWIPVTESNLVEVELSYHFLFDDDPAFNIQQARSTFWLLSASFLFGIGGS